MAGRRLNLTEKKIQDMIKKGCGKGTGSDYIPWLKIGKLLVIGQMHMGIRNGNMYLFHLNRYENSRPLNSLQSNLQ